MTNPSYIAVYMAKERTRELRAEAELRATVRADERDRLRPAHASM